MLAASAAKARGASVYQPAGESQPAKANVASMWHLRSFGENIGSYSCNNVALHLQSSVAQLMPAKIISVGAIMVSRKATP